MTRVLVATGGTEYDQEAVEEALRLLGSGHRYLFLTVYQGVVPAVANFGAMWAPAVVADMDSWDDIDEAARQAGRRRLQNMMERLGVDAELRVESGEPGRRDLCHSRRGKVDLIVVGSPHTTVLQRILGRSVSDDVAHHADRPVLLIRHDDSDVRTTEDATAPAHDSGPAAEADEG